MTSQILQVLKPSIPLKDKPVNKKNITSQMLFGECFEVLSTNNEWIYGISLCDKYKGWSIKKNFGILPNYTHIISVVRSIVLKKPDLKSEYITYLPLRSVVNVVGLNENWVKIQLNCKDKLEFGYISSFHIIKKNKNFTNWVKFAEQMVGTPYRWGGRESFGIDCSALVQLSYAFGGVALPRDSLDQFIFFQNNNNYVLKKGISFINSLIRGNIVYWQGHIGIMVSNNKIIHASGYQSLVLIENLKDVIKRIDTLPILIFFKNQF